MVDRSFCSAKIKLKFKVACKMLVYLSQVQESVKHVYIFKH